MDAGYWVLIIFVSFSFAVFTGIVSDEKGYSAAWFFAGLFFWFIALIAACGLPDRKKKDT